jgi:pimeloyl-ACP methyl ester carboxylesterase
MSRPERFHPPRGELIDIGGRRLRLVRAGRPDAPVTVLCEHGAFGCAADWASVQRRLADRGLRSLAYDRAGLGHSDPGPRPRDGRAIVADLDLLLTRAGETGPLVLVGHSMGGLMVRLFAHAHPDRVLGVVLVDAVVPEALDLRFAPHAVAAFGGSLRLANLGARLGLMRPMSLIGGDMIGLQGEAATEKRRIYASAAHAKGAADEVAQWPATSEIARAAPFPPDMPIAVVTAGAEARARRMKRLQAAPAQASRSGYVEHVAGANHASLLGERFADPVVRGVEHVLKAAGVA